MAYFFDWESPDYSLTAEEPEIAIQIQRGTGDDLPTISSPQERGSISDSVRNLLGSVGSFARDIRGAVGMARRAETEIPAQYNQARIAAQYPQRTVSAGFSTWMNSSSSTDKLMIALGLAALAFAAYQVAKK